MGIGRIIVFTLGGALAVLYALFSSPQQTPGSSLSPKFDGRDTGSPGEYFQNSQKLWLYYQWWLPEGDNGEAGKVKGVVVLLHGFGEHCERYSHLAQDLTANGYAMYSHDHQGHGRSEGDRIYVEKFDHYAKDAIKFIADVVKPKHNNVPIFLMGHSMGGLIALHVAAQRSDLLTGGLILSAPGVQVAEDVANPSLIKIAKVLSAYLPKMPLPGQRVPTDGRITHRKDVVESFQSDPLVYKGVLNARFAMEFLNGIFTVEKELSKISVPIFGFHSRADTLTPIEGCYKVEKQVSSKDKTFKYYDAPYLHELIHEPEVRQEVVSWLNKHVKK